MLDFLSTLADILLIEQKETRFLPETWFLTVILTYSLFTHYEVQKQKDKETWFLLRNQVSAVLHKD